MRRFRFPLGTSITVAIGLVTLLGLLVGGTLEAISIIFIGVTLATAAMAVLVGVVNLLIVHLQRLTSGSAGALYSLVLIVACLGVIGARVVEVLQAGENPPPIGGGSLTGPLFRVLQLSIEGALSGLLAFFLVFAAARMLHRRVTPSSVLFVGVVLIVLLGWRPLPLVGDLFGGLRDWVITVPATGGLRGILIGMALGALIVGIRVLIGRDQPYRG